MVGNDVRIGHGATLMPGVTIGAGAIIATLAVVTGNVPPYTVVGGNPAEPIRKRFAEATLEKLLEIRWRDGPPTRSRAT